MASLFFLLGLAGSGVFPACAESSPPKVVAIDAGHGGQNLGVRGVHHPMLEKDVALAVSYRLRDALAQRPGLHPFLVRDGDVFIPLSERVRKAELSGARLFVSLHVDRVRRRRSRGVVVYFYGRNRLIPKGPEREPDEERLPPPPHGMIQSSGVLADILRRELKAAGFKSDQPDRGAFAVLKSSFVPSVLVEVGNIRDPGESAQVADPAFQKRVAEVLADGIERYLRRR